MKAKSSTKTVFYCSECGNETAKWMGQCPACGAWNTLVEAPKEPKTALGTRAKRIAQPKLISELDAEEELRFSTGIGEFDRVLGGGAVRGSLVLVGGAPGIGKSTLLLQLCGRISERETILYVSGEESQRQLKMRAQRLGVDHGSIYVHDAHHAFGQGQRLHGVCGRPHQQGGQHRRTEGARAHGRLRSVL